MSIKEEKNQKRAKDEIDAIDNIMKRIDEIKAELEEEKKRLDNGTYPY